MNWHDQFLKILNQILLENQTKDPDFSVRKFSIQLGLAVGTLSEILSGKRKLSLKRSRLIVEKLQISDSKKRQLLTQMGDTFDVSRLDAASSNQDIFTDWRLLAIAGLFELERKHAWTASEIANKLGLSAAFVEQQIESLISRKILIRDENQKISKPIENWSLGYPTSPEVLQEIEDDQIRLIDHVRKTLPRDRRVMKALNFSGSKLQIEKLQNEILSIFNRISVLADGEKKEELYRLCIQFFPFDFQQSQNNFDDSI